MQRQEDYQESRSQGMRPRMAQACVDQAAPRLLTRTLLRDQVVHDAGRYYELSLIEAEILRDVNAKGGRGRSHCVVLLNFFKFQGHACMVFETLGMSLYDFLKSNDYIPFPLYCVQSFARQVRQDRGRALAFATRMRARSHPPTRSSARYMSPRCSRRSSSCTRCPSCIPTSNQRTCCCATPSSERNRCTVCGGTGLGGGAFANPPTVDEASEPRAIDHTRDREKRAPL